MDEVTEIYTSVQDKDFNQAFEYSQLVEGNTQDGAVATFVGMVRDYNQGHDIKGLFLEHYAGMTEKSLHDIAHLASSKWELGRIRIIHRIGQLNLGDQIVFVGVTSQHRQASFKALSFLMDVLKSQVPLWKKETTALGTRWVEP